MSVDHCRRKSGGSWACVSPGPLIKGKPKRTPLTTGTYWEPSEKTKSVRVETVDRVTFGAEKGIPPPAPAPQPAETGV